MEIEGHDERNKHKPVQAAHPFIYRFIALSLLTFANQAKINSLEGVYWSARVSA